MGYWHTRGLRGSTLEDCINKTNELYLEKNLAMIQKIPTPIKPIKIDDQKRVITLAYFDQKSTVDYIGVVQGIAVCFDAKETSKKFLSMSNIHKHQIEFMKCFEKQGGEAFLVIYFKQYDTYYFMPLEELLHYYNRALEGGRKSIAYEELLPHHYISIEGGQYIHYLGVLERYLKERE